MKLTKKNKRTNRTGETIYINQEGLNDVKWKTAPCFTRKKCWCRVIIPVKKMTDKEGNELYVVGSACIPKVNAEHIVKVHNASLKKKAKK